MLEQSSDFAPVAGIFDASTVFTQYRVQVKFTEWVLGGIPKNPEQMEGWLRQRIMGGDEELALQLRRTLDEMDIEVPVDASRADLIAAAKKIAAENKGNGFRRSEGQLCLASYNPKAMLKEATSILYPYGAPDGKGKKGYTNKAFLAFLSERIFVDPYAIPLGRTEPDGTMLQVGHISGPRGKRSTLTYFDYCVQPEIEFTLSSSEDMITREEWERILVQGQRLGMGANRSLGYGQFKVTGFERV